MLHVLFGDSSGDPVTIFAAEQGQRISWMVPKPARKGDEVIFFLPGHGFAAFGLLESDPQLADPIGWYSAEIGGIALLPSFVPLPFVRDNCPEWKWATYPRSYTTAKGAVEDRLRKLIASYQSVFGPADTDLTEGATGLTTVPTYERNPVARLRCIQHYGSACGVCGFSFGQPFGESFEGYIHVHHVDPISESEGEYQVDPIQDLLPLCPNCHVVIHSGKPPMSISEVKDILRQDEPE